MFLNVFLIMFAESYVTQRNISVPTVC
jgi:hypothetical protein